MFKVGSVTYSVRIWDGPIRSNGVVCDGLCDEGAREILIAGDIQPDDRLRVLMHELVHAWVYACGEPGNQESWCDMCGTVATAAHADLTRCGGEESLRRLRPGERLGVMTGRIMLSRHRYCRCGGAVPGGMVDCRPDLRNPGQVTLKMGCGHCGITLTWNELATQRGLPSGVPIGEPRIDKGVFIPEGVEDAVV